MKYTKRHIIYSIVLFLFSLSFSILIINRDANFVFSSIIILCLFAAVAESLPAIVGGNAISVSSAITLCALLSYGPAAALITSVFSTIFRVVHNPEKNKYITVFNTP